MDVDQGVAGTARSGAGLRFAADEPVVAVHGGRVRYRDAWQSQKERNLARSNGEVPDLLWTLEHPRVITLGTSAQPQNMLRSRAQLEADGFDVVDVDRGGDVTYHGPGQLIAYPIVALANPMGVVPYVRALEQVAIDVARGYGLDPHREPDYPGVWVGDAKLVALGARVKQGVTMHGIGFNVTTDLADFAAIVPCGIAGRDVCSLASLGVRTSVLNVVDRLRAAFADVFACDVRPAPDL